MSRLSRIAPRLLGLVALVVIALPSGPATASTGADTNAERFYGIWNYDQPNDATLNNVAVLACPDGGGQCDRALPLPLRVPQIGWVEFSPGPHGTVDGRTDQGCAWNFTVHPTGLELSSTTQQCFNPSIGSAGNLTKWSVRIDGDKETESITAVSHQPGGVDLIGTMKSGSRTKVSNGEQDNGFVRRFLGDFDYTPADSATLTNVVLTGNGTVYPEQGTVHISRIFGGKISARTPDRCEWTLAVRGNTAELDPARQTCHTANGEISLHYWALATDDGLHVNGFRAGSTTTTGQPPTDTYLFIGELRWRGCQVSSSRPRRTASETAAARLSAPSLR